jgi:hypothetical protein
MPDYDVEVLALEASLRHPSLSRLPLDVAVPVRTAKSVPSEIVLRPAFLLLHVDDRASVREIASLTDIPVDEALASFLDLAAMGLIELGGAQTLGEHGRGVSVSGTRKTVDPDAGDLFDSALGDDDDTLV